MEAIPSSRIEIDKEGGTMKGEGENVAQNKVLPANSQATDQGAATANGSPTR